MSQIRITVFNTVYSALKKVDQALHVKGDSRLCDLEYTAEFAHTGPNENLNSV